MAATNVIIVGDTNEQIVDTIAGLLCPPGPTDPSSVSTADKAHNTRPPNRPHANVVQESVNGSLKGATVNRLACLLRHWTWADEAMKQFERELAVGWEYDENPLADHPFGSYYRWCALLCGFAEAALEGGLLPPVQLAAVRRDLEECLLGLQACRQLLIVIPASLEEHPWIVEVLRDGQTLDRLRRIHAAFGEALREEQMSRALDWLLYEH
jgi:hypothetical protein